MQEDTEVLQEITLPRKEGRPPYVTTVPSLAVTLTNTESEGAMEMRISVILTDEQWAEYVELPLEEFLRVKAEAVGRV